MARKSFHNIESNTRNGFYPGYSNLGCVRISGKYGMWRVEMGRSTETLTQGIAGMFVGYFGTLETVSQALPSLELTVNNGQREIRVKGSLPA